jgi:hypothetical protein
MFSEFVATFGLLAVIWGCVRARPSMVPFAVGAYITAAYWFTASTSFANPAVTLARAWQLYDSFLSDPRIAFADDPPDIEKLWRVYTNRERFSPKVWNDAYLAAPSGPRIMSSSRLTVDSSSFRI